MFRYRADRRIEAVPKLRCEPIDAHPAAVRDVALDAMAELVARRAAWPR